MDDSCAQLSKSKEIATIYNTEAFEIFLLPKRVWIFEGFFFVLFLVIGLSLGFLVLSFSKRGLGNLT